MGGPKALMETPGGTWWRVQSESLDAVGVEQVWVVSPQVRDELQRHSDSPPRIVTSDPTAPMFNSVLTGLRALAADLRDGVFILPIDTPAPQPHVWPSLCASGTVTVPTHNGHRGHPVFLPAAWVQATLAEINRNQADPRSLRLDTLIAPTALYLQVDDPAVAVNLNTITDLSSYLRAPHP